MYYNMYIGIYKYEYIIRNRLSIIELAYTHTHWYKLLNAIVIMCIYIFYYTPINKT